MAINNESFGISAEVAIAKTYGISINPKYENRADNSIVNLLLQDNKIRQIFEKERIPHPIKHVAEGQNPVDFLLEGGKTLSVKTNQKGLGKVAPQNIGQPTADTYFKCLKKYFPNLPVDEAIKACRTENPELTDYQIKSILFKYFSMEFTKPIVNMYWDNLFDCDYYLHFYNLEAGSNPLAYLLLGREQPPVWDDSCFSFTQTLYNWNESNTLKYNGKTIGEFQVHTGRNCFKFRFNMDGIASIIKLLS